MLLVPKLAEEETHLRNDAIAVRKQRLDHAQVTFTLLALCMYTQDIGSTLLHLALLC